MPAVDHVFVCCSPGAAAEAESLARLGLTEGAANTHPGQGTASRRFFFANAYLELIWVTDADEARSPLAAPTRLWERWSRRAAGACPFALILRPGDTDDGREPPFAAWAYHPPYLPPDLAIDVAEGTPLSEPGLFHLGFARRPDQVQAQPRVHRLPVRALTDVSIVLTGSEPLSPAADTVERAGLVSFSRGAAPFMTLVFDGGAAGHRADLRPGVPLVLQW